MPNLSQLKRQRMLEFLNKIKAEHTDDESLIAINEIETEITEKKYGLVWEEHEERVDVEMQTKVPVFTEVADREIASNEELPYNFLLEGDNLHSLKLLEKTHKGKIDVIYIDPPYNTGNKDFIYDDNFIEAEDTFRHSKWISFMEKRLRVAHNLLSDDGIILISINDEEYASLKLLCDEIYGSQNYQITFHIQVRYPDKSISTEEKAFKPLMEYVLMYSKNNLQYIPNQETVEYGLEKFCYKITELSDGMKFTVGNQEVVVFKKDEWQIEKVEGSLNGLKETWVTGSIYTTMSYGKVFQTVIEPRIDIDGLGCLYKVIGRGDDGLGYRYYTGPQKKTATKGKMYSGVPNEKAEQFITGSVPLKKVPIINSYDFSADFGNIRSEGGIGFNSGKKPIKMLKQLINYHCNKNAVILDFFAGSASTLHAVLSLNEEDNGSRKCIVCTNNEGDICNTITYPRIKNVINGHGNNKGIPANLKYYKTDFIDKTSPDPDYNIEGELLKHIAEMVQLEYAVKLDGTNYVLLMSDEQADNFIANDESLAKCKAIYVSGAVLLTAEQQKKLSDNGIAVFVIPDYYFESELLEVGER